VTVSSSDVHTWSGGGDVGAFHNVNKVTSGREGLDSLISFTMSDDS